MSSGRAAARKDFVWARDGDACHYCKRTPRSDEEKTLDHVWPVSLGGSNARWNLVAACRLCNLRKGSRISDCDCGHCLNAKWQHRERGLTEGTPIRHKRAREAEGRRARRRLGVRYDPASKSWGWYTDQMFNDPDLETR